MSPTSYLAAPLRDIVRFSNANKSSPPKELFYNTKNKIICQLFFAKKIKKDWIFSKKFYLFLVIKEISFFITFFKRKILYNNCLFVYNIYVVLCRFLFYGMFLEVKYENFRKLVGLFHHRYGRRL